MMKDSESTIGSFPEPNDIHLLAYCLRLNKSVLPGIREIVLLTDDFDFREFTKSIKEEFFIAIYSRPTYRKT